ncbi:MAG: hypothetical protein EOM90_11310 [Alphaproteobacteria bacterium]|nr:hypothetical protein [Alphaproteobacteria bacterium]
MVHHRIFSLLAVPLVVISCLFQFACRKGETEYKLYQLSLKLPKLELKNGIFYPINTREPSIEMVFSQPIDPSTVEGNISFSDPVKKLDTACSLIITGRSIVLNFNAGFELNEGSKYFITLTTKLKSLSGASFTTNRILEFRTSSLYAGSGTTGRDAILCISDIHMGEARGIAQNYCWFSENQKALTVLLDDVIAGKQVRDVLILGDLFDEWTIPYRDLPFDTTSGIRNSVDYFRSVATAPVNKPVIDRLRAIASDGNMKLVYIPGNHDMLLDRQTLEEIIPGVIWQADSKGLGRYSPLPEMVMERGHRYDFFCCPQPLINPGQILPPGFFVSRLDAQGLKDRIAATLIAKKDAAAGLEFLLAWTLAYEYVVVQYSMTVHPDSANILMTGIDGIPGPCSFNGIRDMYNASIEEKWPATQTMNGTPVPIPVAMALLNSMSDLFLTAVYEYMSPLAPVKYKVVVFGHTHDPVLKVYSNGTEPAGIYANSGSWINQELSSKPVRTYLLIWPGSFTDTGNDRVGLYQFNADNNSGSEEFFAPKLLELQQISVNR